MVHQDDTTKRKKLLIPHFEGVSPFGNIPYIVTLFISYILMGIVVLLFFKVDKAKHLVFYDFGEVDPFFSTCLIFIYGFLCSVLFVQHLLTDPQYGSEVEKAIPRVFYLFNGILAVLPSAYWLVILIINNPAEHIYSIIISIMMLLYLTTIYFNVDYRFRKIDKNEGIFKIVIDKDQFSAIFIFMGFIIALVFVYMFLKYETSKINVITDCMAKLKDSTNWIKHLFFILGIFVVSGFYRFWVSIKEKFGFWYYILVCFIILICIPLISIGTIHALDIILLYVIILRWLIFELGEIFKVAYNIFIKYGIKNSFKDKTGKLAAREYFSFGFLIFTILIIIVQFSGDAKLRYINQYDIPLSQAEHLSQDSLTTAFRHWIEQRKNNSEHIYIVAGQGGGSRAGCTMFATLAKLDSKDNIKNNILAITTISGSSNGALFYLVSKHLKIQPEIDLDTNLYKLYNVDYVSKSMYKMLFTDRFLYSYLNNQYINRNESHLDLESDAFSKLNSNINSNYLKSMKWHDLYNDSLSNLPIFLPITYNISQGKPAVSAPYMNDVYNKQNYISILDSLRAKNNTMTVSESVALSQMFPFISASGVVNGNNYMDGGVYDNGPFESLDQIYQTVKRLRDEIDSTKKIILISVENGKFENEVDTSTSQIQSVISSVSRSIFSSNPLTHLNELKSNLDYNDTLVNLKIYNDSKPPNKSKWYQIGKYFKIKKYDSHVVMSRYLTKNEIDSILQYTNKSINDNLK